MTDTSGRTLRIDRADWAKLIGVFGAFAIPAVTWIWTLSVTVQMNSRQLQEIDGPALNRAIVKLESMASFARDQREEDRERVQEIAGDIRLIRNLLTRYQSKNNGDG